ASHDDILRHTLKETGSTEVEVVGPVVPPRALASPRQPGYAHTFALIERFPREVGDRRRSAWRIAEFKGTDPLRGAAAGHDRPLPPADTLAIVDHGMGYRDQCDDLADALAAKPRAVVWQTGAPLGGSRLAAALLDGHAERLTVLTSSDELRKDGAQVGYPLSWEQLTGEIVAAVRSGPLARAHRVTVVIGAAGAVLLEREAEDVLVFDPHSQEGDWGKRYPGVGAGYGRCLDAAVTLQLTADPETAPVEAVRRGLAAARAAHVAGFHVDDDGDSPRNPFPLDEVAKALVDGSEEFADIVYRPQRGPSILAQTYAGTSLVEVAAVAAVHGSGSLPHGIPVETVGGWSSVDRNEIESLRGVRNIVDEFVQQAWHGAPVRGPLPIAVFGPPGAGKTFAVRQMATALLPGRITPLEYDLSQFESDAELRAAFHEIRDIALDGDLALVFWDEFDSLLEGQPLGWLRHFLAPMADGRFREGGAFHPLGRAIFVFAGGTAESFEEFIAFHDERAERAAKKPDFISRLRGYVNVTGPNRQDASDLAWPLRRALTLRSLVAAEAPQMMPPAGRAGEPRLQIDDGLLRAFLQIDEYIHGVRSMEAIVKMSSLAGKPRYERSSLPAAQQLAMHVDAAEFMRLVAG
ncbi:MAG TPA: AAA family ATPase, partial [Thermoleophilia bacterium]|nr:AAA family ATPase [Thermoleophilia bacterium]